MILSDGTGTISLRVNLHHPAADTLTTTGTGVSTCSPGA
jgi:hypothetical protein